MTYEQILNKIFSLGTNPKLDLNRVIKALQILNIEALRERSIQIVGTNGKGSTASFLKNILMAHGKKVGIFTSPHLISARERIAIDNELISEEDFIRFAIKALGMNKEHALELSFFEICFLMALLYFAEQEVDFIVLEAGLGGRLDATTALKPKFLGVTSISLDHEHILGEGLNKITFEKLSAARDEQIVVISSKQPKEVLSAISELIKPKNINIIWADHYDKDLSLMGEWQKYNAQVALELSKLVLANNFSNSKADYGLKKTFWPGRLESLNFNGLQVLLDGAHNEDALRALGDFLLNDENYRHKKWALMFSSTKGHDPLLNLNTLLQKSGVKISYLIPSSSDNPRAYSKDEIAKIMQDNFKQKIILDFDLKKDYEKLISKNISLLVTGSLYLVGKIRSQILGINQDFKMPTY